MNEPDYFEQFLTLSHIGLFYVSIGHYIISMSPGGPAWPCSFIHVVLLPIYK
jgi:hypothetical protein